MRILLLLAAAHAGLVFAGPTRLYGRQQQPHNMPVVKTTITGDGQLIDWVPVDAQVQGAAIASPPPPSMLKRSPTVQDTALVDAVRPKDRGPAGTVPIPRASGRGPTKPMKQLPDANNQTVTAFSHYGEHLWAHTGQEVQTHGANAKFSLFKAFVEQSSDFSLLQVGVWRHNAAHAGTGPRKQTVEAGWINFPNQGSLPHLFTFFTANGYERYGDNVCSWNRDFKGWVQVDRDLFPGVAFLSLSTIGGGVKAEADIGYIYYEGNWWLTVLGRWVGYYPGTLFSAGGVNPNDTLNSYADHISFFGEVFNSENEQTKTDMGSGEFPEKGLGNAAYLRNIVYYSVDDDRAVDYDGSAQIIVSDQDRYRLKTSFKSGTDWGSYFYLGGPGAGGVVGG